MGCLELGCLEFIVCAPIVLRMLSPTYVRHASSNFTPAMRHGDTLTPPVDSMRRSLLLSTAVWPEFRTAQV